MKRPTAACPLSLTKESNSPFLKVLGLHSVGALCQEAPRHARALYQIITPLKSENN